MEAQNTSRRLAVDLVELAERLDVLVVFRGLLHDPVIAALRQYLRSRDEGLRGKSLSDYAEFVWCLHNSQASSLAAYVAELACEDENALTRALGHGNGIPPVLEYNLASELETLQMVADLTPASLLSQLEGIKHVPRFACEQAIDVAEVYRERLSQAAQKGFGVYARYRAFVLDDDGAITPVLHPDSTRLGDLVDYEHEKEVVLENTRALLEGKPAANVLLTGDAGTGKSSTVKAVVNELAEEGLRILEVRRDQLRLIPALLDQLGANPLKFILFIDDLSFQSNDDNYAALKAILEGSVSAKSDNVAVYATSNRRHLVKENFSDREGDDIHRNDTLQEVVSLSERFGIHLRFSRPNKETYLKIVHELARHAGLELSDAELDEQAERWALRRGGRSARGARQFVDALLVGIE
ncbi:MAG: ATP-binding protein [Atopobiaceae bacterium]|nr:ATP-binding protein [Atopobiaceae bacterium]